MVKEGEGQREGGRRPAAGRPVPTTTPPCALDRGAGEPRALWLTYTLSASVWQSANHYHIHTNTHAPARALPRTVFMMEPVKRASLFLQ